MSWSLDAIEPHGRPSRRAVDLGEEGGCAVWALPITPDGPRGLRRTVLRGLEENPPPDAIFAFSVRVGESGLTVVDAGRNVVTELLRSDHRSQVVVGMRLPLAANLELTLPDDSRIALGLSLRRQVAQGAALGVAGSSTRRTRVVYHFENPWWVVDGPVIFNSAITGLWDKARDKLASFGFDAGALSFVSGAAIAGGLGLYASYMQYQRAETESARAGAAETALARAEAAQQAALATEVACLDQRKDLVGKLGQLEAKRALAAEMAAGFGLANKAAVEAGGELLGGERLLAADGLLRAGLLTAIVGQMDGVTGDPAPCLAQDAALSNDLPAYLLTYHPDPELICPPDYAVVEGGVDRRGRWGLSERVAREFGAGGNESTGTTEATLEDLLGDPRLEDRWAAFTQAVAYRAVFARLLATHPDDRPPVLPSQSQLWALALYDAWNRVPSTPDGALDAPMQTCLDRVLADRAATAPPAAPGEPLLPDLVAVANGDVPLVASPTPGCPWPRSALQEGAKSALRAAGRLAATRLEPTN